MGWWSTLTNFFLGWLAGSQNVCYDEYGIGCFDNESPYNNAGGLVPESPADIKVFQAH